jgi:hypothetical protein
MADDTQQTPIPAPIQDDNNVVDQVVPEQPESVNSDTSDSPVTIKEPADDKPNPLDVLEKLLDEIDQNKDTKKPSSDKPTGPTPEEIAAQELEKQRLEFEKIKAEQYVIDQKLIAEQREALTNEMQTGEANIARAHQDKEKEEDVSQRDQAEDGYEVIQLDHKKI